MTPGECPGITAKNEAVLHYPIPLAGGSVGVILDFLLGIMLGSMTIGSRLILRGPKMRKLLVSATLFYASTSFAEHKCTFESYTQNGPVLYVTKSIDAEPANVTYTLSNGDTVFLSCEKTVSYSYCVISRRNEMNANTQPLASTATTIPNPLFMQVFVYADPADLNSVYDFRFNCKVEN
jgi:hypothetical protein